MEYNNSKTSSHSHEEEAVNNAKLSALLSQSLSQLRTLLIPHLITLRQRPKTVGGIALALLSMLVYWLSGDDHRPENKPLLASVSYGNIENTVTAAGSLQPSDYVDVGAQVSGQLEKLFVQVGDVVEEGQLLAQIDATVQQQEVEASEASLEAQEAQLVSRESALELAEANAKRQQMLMQEDATSQQEFDTAMNNLVSARANLDQLKAQIQQSRASLARDKAELGFTKLYAPSAGTVVSISLKEGQTLNATQQAPTVLRIADLSIMTVETDVSEADVGKLKNGMEVYFTTLGGGNRRWYGRLQQVLPTPTVTNNVVLYTALFDVDNSDGALLSSMTAQVFFVTSSARNVLTIPLGAIHFKTDDDQGMPMVPPGAPGDFDPSKITPEMRERVLSMQKKLASTNKPSAIPAGAIPPELRKLMPGSSTGRGQSSTPSQSPREAYVKVIDAKGKTEERAIVVGVTSRISAEVISGLTEGEQVVAGIIQSLPEFGGRSGHPPLPF